MTRGQADGLAAEINAVSELARRLGAEFSAQELSQPPAPGAWSAADNLMHLTLASQALVPRMTRTLDKLAGERSERDTRCDWVGRLYAWLLEPPVRFKARAPRPFVPPTGTPVADALPAFLAEQENLLGLAARTAGLDLAARKVPSPVTRYIRYNVYSAFRIALAHERRHLWQARRAATAVRDGRPGV